MRTRDRDENNWGALVQSLACVVAVVIGFRDLNLAYLLIPIWALTGHEIIQRSTNSRLGARGAVALFLRVRVVQRLDPDNPRRRLPADDGVLGDDGCGERASA